MTCCAHMEGVHAGSASHMEHMVENSRSEKEKSILSPRSEDEMCVFMCVCMLFYGTAGCLLMVRVYKNASECGSRGTLVCEGSDRERVNLLPPCIHVTVSVGEFHGSLSSDLQAPGLQKSII